MEQVAQGVLVLETVQRRRVLRPSPATAFQVGFRERGGEAVGEGRQFQPVRDAASSWPAAFRRHFADASERAPQARANWSATQSNFSAVRSSPPFFESASWRIRASFFADESRHRVFSRLGSPRQQHRQREKHRAPEPGPVGG
jgi:hypothetical protein